MFVGQNTCDSSPAWQACSAVILRPHNSSSFAWTQNG